VFRRQSERDKIPTKVQILLECRLATIIQDCLNQVRVDLPAPGSNHSKCIPKPREAPPYLLLLMKKTSKSYDARPTGEARRVLGRIELHIDGLSAAMTARDDGIMPEILRGRINGTARGGDSELKQERIKRRRGGGCGGV
jgi:hypothetical protein